MAILQHGKDGDVQAAAAWVWLYGSGRGRGMKDQVGGSAGEARRVPTAKGPSWKPSRFRAEAQEPACPSPSPSPIPISSNLFLDSYELSSLQSSVQETLRLGRRPKHPPPALPKSFLHLRMPAPFICTSSLDVVDQPLRPRRKPKSHADPLHPPNLVDIECATHRLPLPHRSSGKKHKSTSVDDDHEVIPSFRRAEAYSKSHADALIHPPKLEYSANQHLPLPRRSSSSGKKEESTLVDDDHGVTPSLRRAAASKSGRRQGLAPCSVDDDDDRQTYVYHHMIKHLHHHHHHYHHHHHLTRDQQILRMPHQGTTHDHLNNCSDGHPLLLQRSSRGKAS